MTPNFYSIDGKHRWGLLPVHHVRISFRNGHSEVLRLSEYSLHGRTLRWVRAPGQGGFHFNMEDVVSIHSVRRTWRLGKTTLLEENYRKMGQKI
ncbi:hypothetical protein GOC13_07475 [Sinorhizobium meliloti]|nr:hypothetical protein [Sinorhizobium meliloti]